MKKVETVVFIRLWNYQGYKAIDVMCIAFELTREQVLKRVWNLRGRGKTLNLAYYKEEHGSQNQSKREPLYKSLHLAVLALGKKGR
jgi:hypothetical protein